MKASITIVLLCSIILLQNCGNGTANGANKRSDNDTLLVQWKNDSLGCNGLRTAEKAKALYKQYDLNVKTSNEITEILGKPNKIMDNGTQLSLAYYFDTKCSEGKVIDSIEHCTATFFYIDKAKKDCSLSTSCQ